MPQNNTKSIALSQGVGVPEDSLRGRLRWLIVARHQGKTKRAADAWEIPQPTLSRIVSGHVTSPRAKLLQDIASKSQTTVEWLLTGQGTPPGRFPVSPFKESQRWHTILESLHLPDDVWEEVRHLPWRLWNFITVHDPNAVIDPATANARVQPVYDQVADRSISNWSDALEALIQQRGREKIREQLISGFRIRHSEAGKAAQRQLEAFIEESRATGRGRQADDRLIHGLVLGTEVKGQRSARLGTGLSIEQATGQVVIDVGEKHGEKHGRKPREKPRSKLRKKTRKAPPDGG